MLNFNCVVFILLSALLNVFEHLTHSFISSTSSGPLLSEEWQGDNPGGGV